MLYCVTLEIPANTPKENAVEKQVVIKERYLESIYVFFPPGHVCLTRVAVFYGEDQIFPDKDHEWVFGNNTYVGGYVFKEIPRDKPIIRVKGYNLDTEYDHTVYVFINTNDINMLDVYNALIRLSKVIEKTYTEIYGVSVE